MCFFSIITISFNTLIIAANYQNKNFLKIYKYMKLPCRSLQKLNKSNLFHSSKLGLFKTLQIGNYMKITGKYRIFILDVEWMFVQSNKSHLECNFIYHT